MPSSGAHALGVHGPHDTIDWLLAIVIADGTPATQGVRIPPRLSWTIDVVPGF
jgi:hypothetical protein